MASLLLGATFGALGGGPLADGVGRRWAIMVAALIFFLGVVPETEGRSLEEIEADMKVRGMEGNP